MKHGSHIMLQRFVRSTVRTEPRPYLTVLRAVVVQFFVVVGRNVTAGKVLLDPLEELHVDGHHVFGISVLRTVLDHPDLAFALDDLGFDLANFSCSRLVHSFSPPMIFSRASFTHLGHSESVCRGQPRVGLVFCQDFKSGFSVHFGVNEGAGLNRLKYWMVSKATPALTNSGIDVLHHALAEWRLGLLRAV